MIDKNTNLCISLSKHPSNFGVTVHNAAYKKLKLNYLYKSFGINDIGAAILGVRALGIRGCGISMPFKENVIDHLDKVDKVASYIGAVNTVVNVNGKLIGYNTDVHGAIMALKKLKIKKNEKVMILGAGGVAKAILYALKKNQIPNVIICNRNLKRAKLINEFYAYNIVKWEDRNFQNVDVCINATSLGMYPNDRSMPISKIAIRKIRALMDVVVNPIESKIIKCATELNKDIVQGYVMSLYQAAAQFELYTNQPAPLKTMKNSILKLFN